MHWIQMLIMIHAITGGIALFNGALAIGFKKGSRNHKRSGKAFYFSMLLSACVALWIAVLPGHTNTFLFSIGLFSLYFLIIGKRAMLYKSASHSFQIDQWISYAMVIASAAIPLTPYLSGKPVHFVALVFGIFGLVMAIANIYRFRKAEWVRKRWLSFHIGHITGGYIAAFTAFIVVNNLFPPAFAWVGWIAPGVLGGIYISFWIRKTKPKIKTA
jgi:hypothetical protein